MAIAPPFWPPTAERAAALRLRLSAAGPSICFVIYIVATAFLFWPTFASMTSAWLTSSAYMHGALVAPISLWLIRSQRAHAAPAIIWPAAYAGLAGAALLWLAGEAASVNLVRQAAFVTFILCGAALFFGRKNFLRFATPLALLYFMVPFGDTLLPALQDMTARCVALLLAFSGVEASLEGLIITTRSGRYAIAEACAGLNFLLAATFIACAFSIYAISGWTKRAGFIAFAVLLAATANIARAWLVILAATLSDGAYRIGADHIVFGWAFYAAMLFVLIGVGRRLADTPPQRHASGKASKPATGENFAPAKALAGAVLILAACAAYAHMVIDRKPALDAPARLPPLSAPGWRLFENDQGWRPPSQAAARISVMGYEQTGVQTIAAITYAPYEGGGYEIAGYDSRAADGAVWRGTSSGAIALRIFGDEYQPALEIIEDAAGRRFAVATLYWLGETVYDRRAALKFAQARQRLIGVQNPGGAIYLAASEDGGERDAGERIARFAAELEPFEAWRARVNSYRPR